MTLGIGLGIVSLANIPPDPHYDHLWSIKSVALVYIILWSLKKYIIRVLNIQNECLESSFIEPTFLLPFTGLLFNSFECFFT